MALKALAIYGHDLFREKMCHDWPLVMASMAIISAYEYGH